MEQTVTSIYEALAPLLWLNISMFFLFFAFRVLRRYFDFEDCVDVVETNSEINEVYEIESNNVHRYDLPDCFYE